MIEAVVIEDSISPLGIRLTTLQCTFHRFILAEFNTHRVFSRNSASSRAIPAAKTLAQVTTNTAFPEIFPLEQSGMSGGERIELFGEAEKIWQSAADSAVRFATKMAELGVHKSVVNRIVEPYMWHTVVVSSTDYDNFFIQRMQTSAQPEMIKLAYRMSKALEASRPTAVGYGEWHLPYVTQAERSFLLVEQQRELSVARVAGVSYNRLGQVRENAKDFGLYSKLRHASPPHWSPFEHVATPVKNSRKRPRGNFAGWHQLRHIIDSNE